MDLDSGVWPYILKRVSGKEDSDTKEVVEMNKEEKIRITNSDEPSCRLVRM